MISALIFLLTVYLLSMIGKKKHFYPAYLNRIIKWGSCFFHLKIVYSFTWKNLSSSLNTVHHCWFCSVIANHLDPWLSLNDNSSFYWEPIFMYYSVQYLKKSLIAKRMSKLIFLPSMNSSRNSELLSFPFIDVLIICDHSLPLSNTSVHQ